MSAFDPNHCCPVIILTMDRPDGNHVYTSFALMRSYSAWGPIQRNVDDSQRVEDLHDQAIAIALYPENHPVFTDDTCV